MKKFYAIAILICCTLAGGCASANFDPAQAKQTHDQRLDALERGKAKGQLKMHAGGHLLSVGATNEFFAGPSGTFEFEGDIDFSREAVQADDGQSSDR